MTTKVTVDAHAGWPVKVTTVDEFNGEKSEASTTVQPQEVREFYVTQTRKLVIEEMPNEVPQAARV